MLLLRREFVVPAAPQVAWEHLANLARWPRWASHIRRIDVTPGGRLGPESAGVIRLRNGMRSTFRMIEFHPPHNWKWRGPFLWLSVDYDHRFEPAPGGGTRMIWLLEASGFAVGSLGRLFAAIYARNLDRAIPRLIEELHG